MNRKMFTRIALIVLSVLTLILAIALVRCERHKAIIEADLVRAVSRGVKTEGHWILCKQKCSQCD